MKSDTKTKNMEKEIQKLKDTIKWYEDYSKVVYANEPDTDQYARNYANERQEIRKKNK